MVLRNAGLSGDLKALLQSCPDPCQWRPSTRRHFAGGNDHAGAGPGDQFGQSGVVFETAHVVDEPGAGRERRLSRLDALGVR